MSARKQCLLARHRRIKRVALLLTLVVLLAVAVLVSAGLALILLLAGWLAHEAWFSDHLFYSPRADYRYRFDPAIEILPARLENGRLRIEGNIAEDDALFLEIRLRATWLGRFCAPAVDIMVDAERDRQTFELGASGLRYLNLTGFPAGEIRLRGLRCRMDGAPRLLRIRCPDYRQQRLLVVAPHADDAELAAFGLYTQASQTAWIVTLTAGEIETGHYQRMGLDAVSAARLKGRLRAWDSLAVPRWAGIAAERIVHLGYFCMRLADMRETPAEAMPSREAELADTRFFRSGNPLILPGDADGQPTWNNLLADLRALIALARPEVIVLPHPGFDPHPDHVAAYAAVREALADSDWQPQTLLCYANHLHDNDMWPMGNAHAGVPLPPLTEANELPLLPWSLALSRPQQIDKASALAMMHDLQPPLPKKRRLRRLIQTLLTGRRWPCYGENEYFRKAVRRQEIFWVEAQKTAANR
ncbi:MAG: PIG-L family deacetylase [Zoogloeaceae bacterium]|jgi:LmbE family N-acetylglucosaminyl deacetylase|nr:PIG-L family deacetylase [Zoogloeaceae bacterium]